jgi:3'(2'), 5'-bisphosphate nucleotidase
MYISAERDQKIRSCLRECGQQAQKLAREPFDVSQKGPGDYVTSVDQFLDRQLSAEFSAFFPEDGIITEENALSRGAFDADYQRLWCIDPLDGTEEFIKGKLHYAVMVGLLAESEPVAGWIYAPAFEQMYFGGKDWGLFQTVGDGSPQPLMPIASPAPTTENCRIVLGDKDQKNFGRAIAEHIPGAEFYSLGSFGLKVMEIIFGRAGLYVYLNGRVKVWDTAGPLALAKAAGLVCCDLDGEPIEWTTDVVDRQTLAHKQSIAIGWPNYIEPLLEKVQQAVRHS